MTDKRRRCTFVTVLFATLVLALPALASDSDLDRQAQKLKSKLVLVFLFERDMPELAARGQGLSQLDAELRGVLSDSQGAPAILDLFLDLQLRWARLLESRGDIDGALLHFDQVIDRGPDASGFADAASAAADIHESRADAFKDAGNDTAALEGYRRAGELCRMIGNTERAHDIARKSTEIAAREGMKAYQAKQYDSAFDTLSALAEQNPPGFTETQANQALIWMRENTGILTIVTLKVPDQVPGQSIAGLGTHLKPVRGGQEDQRAFAGRFRWVTGEYAFSLLGPGGGAVLTLPVNLTTSGAAVSVPSKVPDGMAFIPAGGKVSRPYFIDRTEVTVEDFKRLFPAKRFALDRPTMPAHGITFEEARDYATRIGKKLPSFEQWERAAFGDSGQKYPWGSDDSMQRHCNIGTSGPREVGSFPSGRSKPFELDDMAGNVWEWLDDQYAIGGGFGKKWLVSPYAPTGWSDKIQYLRDKRPDDKLYAGFADPDKRERYDVYRVEAKMLGEVGFRCVLEF